MSLKGPSQCRNPFSGQHSHTMNPLMTLPTPFYCQHKAGMSHYLFDVLMDVLGCLLGQLCFTCSREGKKKFALNQVYLLSVHQFC